jgi:polyisoprenoid-binding protein YceI
MKMKFAINQRAAVVAGALVSVLALAGASVQPSFAQATATAPAAGIVRYESVPKASHCVVEGTSTLHDWKMETELLSGSIETDAGFPESALANPAAARPVVRLRVPMRTLKSDKASMDNTMQDHMEVTKYPNVEYRLIELKPKSPAGTKGAIQFDAVGTLTIYGKTLTNTMPVTIEKKDDKLTVTGSTPVKMSDYGIPKLTAFGLTVGDELKINFSWVAAPKAKPVTP